VRKPGSTAVRNSLKWGKAEKKDERTERRCQTERERKIGEARKARMNSPAQRRPANGEKPLQWPPDSWGKDPVTFEEGGSGKNSDQGF